MSSHIQSLKSHIFHTNDGIQIFYRDDEQADKKPMILIHGFTGASDVFMRNIPDLSTHFRVIAPDLRGHGRSEKPRSGFHVSRLAADLKDLIEHLKLSGEIIALGASLGCAVLWSYSELFTPRVFSHLIFVDQAPLQNYTPDGSWGPGHGNYGCNSAAALATIQTTLKLAPEIAHKGTISSCLAYRSHPQPTDHISEPTASDDEKFFLDIAMKGDGEWFGKLMADHTSLDWRDSIASTLGRSGHGNAKNFDAYRPKVLVIASSRSGCFPAAGPLKVVQLVNEPRSHVATASDARLEDDIAFGVTIDWAGHWCYYEDPSKFNRMVLDWLSKGILDT